MKNQVLEFDQILKQVSTYAMSENAKNEILELKPMLSERSCKKPSNSKLQRIILKNIQK